MNLDDIACLDDITDEIKGHSVLLRVSFDAFDKSGNLKDGLRIEASESTIQFLRQKGAKRIVLLTYAGRPERGIKSDENARYSGTLYDKRLSLRPAADFLHGMLKEYVHFVPAVDESGEFYEKAEDYIKHASEYISKNTSRGNIILLDNLRFWEGENNGDPEFSKLIASLGSIYVQDGFAQAHRVNNATIGEITMHTKMNVMGLQFKKEVQCLKGVFDNLVKKDRGSFIFIIGGKKIETKPGIVSKIDVANKLIRNMQSHDKIFIGGAMSYPFIIAKRFFHLAEKDIMKLAEEDIRNVIGNSYIEWNQLQGQIRMAKTMLGNCEECGIGIELPKDHIGLNGPSIVCTKTLSGMVCGDIGYETVSRWKGMLEGSDTIILAGPVGWYENESFSGGSRAIAEAVANATQHNGTVSIAAGGDTSTMVRKFGLGGKFSLVSTGGGATLEFLMHGGLRSLELLDTKQSIKNKVMQ